MVSSLALLLRLAPVYFNPSRTYFCSLCARRRRLFLLPSGDWHFLKLTYDSALIFFLLLCFSRIYRLFAQHIAPCLVLRHRRIPKSILLITAKHTNYFSLSICVSYSCMISLLKLSTRLLSCRTNTIFEVAIRLRASAGLNSWSNFDARTIDVISSALSRVAKLENNFLSIL